jgi:hypothetical protein
MIQEARINLRKLGEPVNSRMEAIRRFSDGDQIFAFHDMGSDPMKITDLDELENFTPDQLLAVSRHAISDTKKPKKVVEFVDVDAIHAEALREHLLSNPEILENHQDFADMREFLKLHSTAVPSIGDSYVYASVQVTPFVNFLNIAHFENKHQVKQVQNDQVYFDINGVTRKFPSTGKLFGDALSEIYFFSSEKEFQEFNTLLSLKFPNYRKTYKILDSRF